MKKTKQTTLIGMGFAPSEVYDDDDDDDKPRRLTDAEARAVLRGPPITLISSEADAYARLEWRVKRAVWFFGDGLIVAAHCLGGRVR